MTIELISLLAVTALAASLWLPFVIGLNTAPTMEGGIDPMLVPRDPLQMRPWVARAYRAHQNLLEQFLPFAAVVLIAAHLGVSTPISQGAAIAFVALWIAHAVGMISGWARLPLRPLIFSGAYIAILVLIWQVIAHT
ncbi:MAG: MAPEG family protein [Pseudomonadota bacterium]